MLRLPATSSVVRHSEGSYDLSNVDGIFLSVSYLLICEMLTASS